jgi:hypothetical protein
MQQSDPRHLKWYVMSPRRTAVGLVFTLTAIAIVVGAILCVPLGGHRIPRWAAAIAGVFAALGLRAAFQGGCTVDKESRRLTRWWGLFVPLWTRTVPFSEIRTVWLSYGLFPGDPRPARDRHVSYNLAVEVNGAWLLLRRERNHQEAAEWAAKLVQLFHVPLRDSTLEGG